MNWKAGFGVVAALAVAWTLMGAGDDLISSADAHAMVKNGARLLDVRTTEEFADGHIQGAINIPVQELEKRLSELGAKDKAIVVYCYSGGRAHAATQLLRSAGFSHVYDLGAMHRWDGKR